jgi:hypothetical protein
MARFVPIALVLFLFGCGGGSVSKNAVTPPPPPANNAAFFGMHLQVISTPWPSIGFGSVRVWSNSSAARWAQINPSDGVYDFSVLDTFLAEFYEHGITDVLYTVGEVPVWASSNPSDTACDFATKPSEYGGCDLPNDLNLDGTGTDQTFINFITAIAQHVNDPTYLQTHAHIQYWEPWNEIWRDNLINPVPYKHTSVRATYAQLIRMAQDLRCTITGTGVVNGVPCTATPIDSTALILSDSDTNDDVDAGGPLHNGAVMVFQNYLYCNGTGSFAPISGSYCTTGTAGSAVSDIINAHFYEGGAGALPENLAVDVPVFTSVLSATDSAKPFWSGEGSWNKDANVPDPDIAASWVARYYLVGWSTKLSRLYWYGYDSSQDGTLWTPGGGLNLAGVAYGQVYNWIVGSTLTTPCSATGTIWTCGLTLANGNAAEAIWDTSQTCSNGTCTTSNQNVSSAWTNYEDLTGNNNPITNGTVPVGIKPILLTPSAP